MNTIRATTAFLCIFAAGIGGCSTTPTGGSGAMHSTAMPGRLQHIVLVDLTDDSEIAAMKADSDRMLPTLPMVKGYICGTPVDIGRGNVSKDYDIGLVVQFDSVEDYKAYLEHPVHKELVATWRPKWRRSYIVDFGL
jgi:hypothetical protein